MTERRRVRVAGTAVAVACSIVFAALPAQVAEAAAARTELIAETFAGDSTRPGEWEAPSPKGSHTPCLTAATNPPAGSLKACNAVKTGREKPDPVGQGVFQLTDNSKQDAGGLVLNKPLGTKQGLQVEFDMYMYNRSTAQAADGISFYLLDGSQEEETTGEPGGSLGYTGIKGAVIGFGFDQFGNFSTNKAGPADKSQFIPNNIGVRGAESTKFRYITGVKSPAPLDAPSAKTRASAKRHVTVAVSATNFLSLSVDYNDDKGPQKLISDFDLDGIKGQPKLPETLKLGWAASTGNSTSVHEISGFRAASLDPNLSVKVSGEATLAAGKSGTAQVVVGNAQTAGPTTGAVTATYKVPAGLKADAATGDGWKCDVVGDTVSCTRPDVLKPGGSAPPITIKYTAEGSASGKLVGIATAATQGEPKDDDNTAEHPVSISAAEVKAPDLALDVKGEVTLAPGQGGSATLTVSNQTAAGPTTGTVTATYKVPAGLKVDAATGDGWKCDVVGDTVSCTRPDVLKPGSSAPPITIKYTADLTASGKLTGNGTANTPGNSVEAGATGKLDVSLTGSTSTTKPPSVSATVSHDGTPTAGGTTPYHVTVSNKPDAGPTTGTVTARFTAPTGSTVKSATGDGWKCTVAGLEVTCTRDDVLKPGKSFPPVNVEVTFPAGTGGSQVTAQGGVDTPGDADPSDNAGTDQATLQSSTGASTGLKIKVAADPKEYKVDKPFTYTVTVTNDGPDAAKGAVLDVGLPDKWTKVPWACKATDGSACPRPVITKDGYVLPLKGNLKTTVDVAAGGSVVLTLTCHPPAGFKSPIEVTAALTPPAGAKNADCADTCVAKLTAPKSTSWWPF